MQKSQVASMINFRSTLITIPSIATRYLCVILLSIPTSLVLLAAGHTSYALRWLIMWTLTLIIPLWAGLEYLLEHPIRQDGTFFRFSGLWLLRRFSVGRRLVVELSHNGLIKPLLSPIPVEIWTQIIEHAIAVPEFLGTDCDSKNVPEFLHHHQMHTNHLFDDLERFDGNWSPNKALIRPTDPYHRSEWFRNQLRLVCSGWKDIVDRHATRLVFHSKVPNIRSRWGRGIQRVDMFIQGQYVLGEAGSTYHGTYLSPFQDQLSAVKILAMREEGRDVLPTGGDDAIGHLALNPTKILESIQSFAYHAHISQLSPQAILLLSTSLTNLRILILETLEITGDVMFPQLHSLRLNCDNINLSGWECPNLRHLVVINHELPWRHHDTSIIPEQFNGLTALIIHTLVVELNNTFWSRFHSLELLGCCKLTLVDPPPERHPLAHLYAPRINIYNTSPHELAATLGVLHSGRERSLRIGKIPSATELKNSEFAAEWEELYHKCKREGIRWRRLSKEVGFVDEWPRMHGDYWDERIGKWIKEWNAELIFSGIHSLITLVLAADALYFVETPQWTRFMQSEILALGVVFTIFCFYTFLSFNSHRFVFPLQSSQS